MSERPFDHFITCVRVSRETSRAALAFCPAHDDQTSASLSVREGPDGRVLINCFAGCTASDIVAKLKLKMRDLYPWKPGAAVIHQKPRATYATLKFEYDKALATIVKQRPAFDSDAPVTTTEKNRARAIAEFKFRDTTLPVKTMQDWESHPPYDRDPLWPMWYAQTLRRVMLERWAKTSALSRPGETDPAGPTAVDRMLAANETANAIRLWAMNHRSLSTNDAVASPSRAACA